MPEFKRADQPPHEYLFETVFEHVKHSFDYFHPLYFYLFKLHVVVNFESQYFSLCVCRPFPSLDLPMLPSSFLFFSLATPSLPPYRAVGGANSGTAGAKAL
jgi:hypothetical protein